MADWSGSYNGGTMNNGDRITGNVTIADGFTLTVTAGATITVTGNYTLTNNGKATYVGTAAAPIIFKSVVTAPTYNSWGGLRFTSIDATSVVSYVKIYNANYAIQSYTATSSAEITYSNLYFENCYICIYDNSDAGENNTYSYIKALNCYCLFQSRNVAKTTTIEHCDYFGTSLMEGVNCPSATIVLSDVMLNGMYLGSGYGGYGIIYDFEDSLILGNNGLNFLNYTATASVLNNSLVTGVKIAATDVSTFAFTNCDFINNSVIYTAFGIGGVANSCAFTNCYFAGYNSYLATVFDTYVSGATTVLSMATGISAMTDIRIVPNFSFSPSSLAESALGDDTVQLDWTVGFKTKHRVKYGTATGVYTMIAEPDYDWANWDTNKTTMTTIPSIVLDSLTAGTTYYYVVESWDWALQVWTASAEGSFVTTSSAPVISNQLLDSTDITTAQDVIAQCDATNTPDAVVVVINGKSFPLTNTVGDSYSATIKGVEVNGIGVCSAETATFIAVNAQGGDEANAPDTLTVTYGLL